MIESFDDQYEGWVDHKQITLIDNETFNQLILSDRHYVKILSASGNYKNGDPFIFTLGAHLPFFHDGKFRINEFEGTYEGNTIAPSDAGHASTLTALAKQYLGAPYLWGGRSPFGIDCSGYVQILFKMTGLMLPRDASQQINHGENINFVSEAEPGDLAFFGNEEGDIIHVGIVIEDFKIIHASGKVRIDKLDHQGIFNLDTQSYSHNLRLIKRILS